MKSAVFFLSILCASIVLGQNQLEPEEKNEIEVRESVAPALVNEESYSYSDIINILEVPQKKPWIKRFPKKKTIGFRKAKKQRQYVDWDWAGTIFIILGLLIILGGFVLIILTTILPWWWFLIGLAAILVGITIAVVGAEVIGGKNVGLGVVAGIALTMIIGMISLVIWGLVELILWIIG